LEENNADWLNLSDKNRTILPKFIIQKKILEAHIDNIFIKRYRYCYA